MDEYFEYLTELRDGGTLNMMWAPTMLHAVAPIPKAAGVFTKEKKYVCFRLDYGNGYNNRPLLTNKTLRTKIIG